MNRKPIYTSFGIVIHGRGIGKLVGTPTANLKVENEKQLPENGVYITRIFLDNQIYYGITHIGTRPTVDNDTDISVETHILNFSRDLYGSKIEIQLFEKLRNPMKFDNLSLLLEQIRLDCLSVQEFWGIDYSASRLTIDIKKHLVKVDGKEVFLSTKEFDVLYMLYSNPEVTFTKEEIYQLHLECNDLLFSVCINSKDLLGEPAVGRRFKGQIWMQGRLNFEEIERI